MAIECCYQNVGIATSLALTMFSGEELNQAMGVPFLYGMAEVVFISIYCIGVWKMGWTKAPAGENLFKVLATSYEVETSDQLLEEEGEGDGSNDELILPSSSTTIKTRGRCASTAEDSAMAATTATEPLEVESP